ncbi:MAG: OPT/YSL family transporter [Burkholderiales bacterium]|nr:OPT/YSL family transporter [Burkholderiales bacterium]MDE2276624.1 OPT/YSL family transporter [Burkholderiales bacterium]
MSLPSTALPVPAAAAAAADTGAPPRWAWLPAPGSWRYHALLVGLGVFVLGPLGGVTAAYMNFSLGFFVGGQVLAGILGSTVTYGYGAQGRHGANYMQTAAASAAGLSAMGVLIQAMVWMGLPQPPLWQLVLYMLCIGMFGAGVGMLYTPILVDRMQLTFPSGLAVANILRALTDPVLLRASVGRLGAGVAVGLASGIASAKVALLGAIELSASTFGAGMVVGARIGIPAVVGGLLGVALAPGFVSIGWLQPGDPPRKIMFLIALGTIMGAALVDMGLIAWQALQRLRQGAAPAPDSPDWKRVNTRRLVLWVAAWGTGIVLTGHGVLGQPVGYLLFAVALVFVFAVVNGISVGISDSNPISSAFVVSVVLMAALGLRDPGIGLMAGTVLLVSTSVACDMQQDRSTGWRLGTNRVLQFRYQCLGILMGALLSVGFARLFMAAYPVLRLDQTVMTAAQQPAQWSAAMTYKFVGILRSLTEDRPYQRTAIWVGVGVGLAIELLRKLLRASAGWRRFAASGRAGYCTEFVVDAVLLPSPYALSFGGFVNLNTSLWFGAGGVASSAFNALPRRRPAPGAAVLPEDMSSASLFGGGLIAGDALAALGLGIAGLLGTLLGR